MVNGILLSRGKPRQTKKQTNGQVRVDIPVAFEDAEQFLAAASARALACPVMYMLRILGKAVGVEGKSGHDVISVYVQGGELLQVIYVYEGEGVFHRQSQVKPSTTIRGHR